MKFSVIGFIVGAICALILYGVGTSLVVFSASGLVFGLAALLLWWYVTTHWTGPEV
jgi:hypothetical protein